MILLNEIYLFYRIILFFMIFIKKLKLKKKSYIGFIFKVICMLSVVFCEVFY